MELKTSSRRPKTTLYLTFRIVQLVNQLRRRLKLRLTSAQPRIAESKRNIAPWFAEEATRGISKLLIAQDHAVKRCIKQRNGAHDIRDKPRAREGRIKINKDIKQEFEASEPMTLCTQGRKALVFIRLSNKISKQLGFGLIHTAKDDRRFIRKARRLNFSHLTWLQAAENVRLVNAALEVLTLSGPNGRAEDEKTIANLEHLLLCIRHRLVHTFVAQVLNEIRASLDWRLHSRRHLKFGGDKWCAVFANSRRPISTTGSFPWSIRPSLAILWGVCWMFYPGPEDTGFGRWQLLQLTLPPAVRQR